MKRDTLALTHSLRHPHARTHIEREIIMSSQTQKHIIHISTINAICIKYNLGKMLCVCFCEHPSSSVVFTFIFVSCSLVFDPNNLIKLNASSSFTSDTSQKNDSYGISILLYIYIRTALERLAISFLLFCFAQFMCAFFCAHSGRLLFSSYFFQFILKYIAVLI